MDAVPDLSRLARTIGEPTRLRMLTLLMDGRALTAKELAYGAGVAPATGTTHLRLLLGDSLVQVRPQGRHKYFRLASPAVAQCIESLLAVAPSAAAAERVRAPIHQARFCYDHLAGWLGTEITRVLLQRKLLSPGARELSITRRGQHWFAGFGIDLAAARNTRRKFAFLCLDWSERREHLGGALGAAVAQRLLDAGWIFRRPDSRVLAVTANGREALHEHFGLRFATGIAATVPNHVPARRPHAA